MTLYREAVKHNTERPTGRGRDYPRFSYLARRLKSGHWLLTSVVPTVDRNCVLKRLESVKSRSPVLD
jgi:hypothetical protein